MPINRAPSANQTVTNIRAEYSKSGRHVWSPSSSIATEGQTWAMGSTTLKISRGASTSMTKDACCNQLRQINMTGTQHWTQDSKLVPSTSVNRVQLGVVR